ncbi:MAG: inosine/xanthosine triphosphatase [Patescibacteria group bacterium]|nr:inosine/xanthosine triphosphatase [Patescibacteria group bacterium]
MIIFVGSANPVKINAATIVASEAWPEAQVSGYSVSSGINEQPLSDDETKTGAINRAKNVLQLGLKKIDKNTVDSRQVLGVGLEGGIFLKGEEMWTTVWGAAVDREGKIFTANGARFKVPPMIAELIKDGVEMGPAIAKYFKGRKVKEQEGMIGVITKKFVDRTEEYSSIAKLCLGLWYGQGWKDDLLITEK